MSVSGHKRGKILLRLKPQVYRKINTAESAGSTQGIAVVTRNTLYPTVSPEFRDSAHSQALLGKCTGA